MSAIKELQALLPRLAKYPKQPISKEFVEFTQSIINQYYQQTETNYLCLAATDYYTSINKPRKIVVFNDVFEKLNQDFIKMGATANPNFPKSLLINGPGGDLGTAAFQLSDSWFIIKQELRLPTETSCQGFISAVNKQIQGAADSEHLAKLQENLEQLVNEPKRLLTKEFVKLINSTVNEYYKKNKEKLTETPEAKHLFSMLECEFSSILSRDLWPNPEIYGPNVTVDHHGVILIDENHELKENAILGPDIYKDAKNQQQLIDVIKLTLSANISQLKKHSASIFTLPLLSTKDNKITELNTLQHHLDELIEDPKQPLTQPFIQQIRRKVLLYLFTPSAKKTEIGTLEALQQGLNQLIEQPEQPLPATFIKLITKDKPIHLYSAPLQKKTNKKS